MKAHVGDTITIRARKVGGAQREGVITAVKGADGKPPYRVRWTGDERDHLLYPGTDAIVKG